MEIDEIWIVSKIDEINETKAELLYYFVLIYDIGFKKQFMKDFETVIIDVLIMSLLQIVLPVILPLILLCYW